MEINSLQGAGAYAKAPNAAPPVDNTQQVQTNDTSRTNLNTENTANNQRAYEVTLTPEAQDRMAAETSNEPVEEPAETQPNATNQIRNRNRNEIEARNEVQAGQTPAPAQANSPIVNIVA